MKVSIVLHNIYYYTNEVSKLSLRMLSQMITAELINPNQIHICEKFLRVASIVLSWNFASRFALFKTRILLNELKTTSFIPPPSWSEFFENSDIIDLFMEVRTNLHILHAGASPPVPKNSAWYPDLIAISCDNFFQFAG